MFQFSYFLNHIGENSTLPSESYPNGVFVGTSVNTPQTTEQHKYQFRDDFTWTQGKHELRVGASFIYEPDARHHLLDRPAPLYVHLADSRTSPISSISFNGSIGGEGGGSVGTIPNNQYSLYVQDGWRVNDKLILDIGVRYDLVTGFAFDQDSEHHLLRADGGGRRRACSTAPACPVPAPASRTSARIPRRTRTTSRRASASPTTSRATATSCSAAASAATTTSPTPTRTSCSP